jgi:hypothetical protein
MFSKPLAFGLLALGCLTAAAGGAYLATRHNTADALKPAPQAAPASATPSTPAEKPVAETEAPVAAAKPASDTTATPAASQPDSSSLKETAPNPAPVRRTTTERLRTARPSTTTAASTPTPAGHSVPVRETQPSQAPADGASSTPAPATTSAPVELPSRAADPQPERARVPQFEEVVLPAASVIGLQVETPLSSERARIEDRVEARVTRDVMANGRVAIPAGSRVLGSVTLVDKGGKLKERARLGIRFHTLVLADGTDVPLNTEQFFREGESPAGDSAKKIGGAAIGGAILGAILGGGKGAAIGGTTGAAGGTAAVMAGDRNPATVAPGSIVSVRLSSPVTIQVEKKE